MTTTIWNSAPTFAQCAVLVLATLPLAACDSGFVVHRLEPCTLAEAEKLIESFPQGN